MSPFYPNLPLFRYALRGVTLSEANLALANLSEANLSEAVLTGADLSRADLTGANLGGAFLMRAILVETNLDGANISGCHIYGVSAWGVNLESATQANLVITDDNEPIVTVDNLEVAQFVYLLLHNAKIRDVIDTITTKTVLILGRFTDERKAVLDAIREGSCIERVKLAPRRRTEIPCLHSF